MIANPQRVIRCSALPRLAQCAASAVRPEVRIESPDEFARVGTAVHSVLAALVRGEYSPSVTEAAARDRVADGEVGALAGSGWRCWQSLAEHFREPQVEQELCADIEGIRLTGHTDLLSVECDEVRVLDWKTSRLDEDYTDQLRGYCLLGMIAHPETDTARACLVRVRQQEWDWYEWTRDELSAWWESLAQRLADTETYTPGRHCTYCPRAHECPARQALAASSHDLIVRDSLGLPDNCGAIYDGLRLMESVCQSVREQLAVEVGIAGGRLATGDGRELVLTIQNHREIDYRRGCEPLSKILPDDVLDGCFRVSKTAIEEAVRVSAPRGKKSAAIEDLYARLEEAGAITTRTVQRMECRRIVPKMENRNDSRKRHRSR